MKILVLRVKLYLIIFYSKNEQTSQCMLDQITN